MRSRRWAPLVAALAATALALGACGDDDSEPAQEGGELTKLRVGVLPIDGLEPLYIAMKRGYFREEGLQVTPQIAQGGAAILPSVMSGDLQFGFSNNVSLLIANDRGLPVRIVANGGDAPVDEAEADYSVLVAREGGPVRKPADLVGRKVAVNTLKNIGEVTVGRSLEKVGVDIRDLKLVEVPFPDMVGALDEGGVDAAWLVEPFSTLATEAGARILTRPYYDTKPGLTIATYFTSDRYAEENPEVVEGFTRAIERATEDAAADPALVRRTLLTYTEIPPDVAERMKLVHFSNELEQSEFDLIAQLMKRYGVTEEEPKVEGLLPGG